MHMMKSCITFSLAVGLSLSFILGSSYIYAPRTESRHLQENDSSSFLFGENRFCRKISENRHETATVGLLRSLWWFLRRYPRGTCGENCPDICKHQSCLLDYESSADGSTCQCLQNAETLRCPVNTECSTTTGTMTACVCLEDYKGDPAGDGCWKCFDEKSQLQEAVDLYITDTDSYMGTKADMYGYPMGVWCVSRITDFSSLFAGSGVNMWNESLANWDVSNGVTMKDMFQFASTYAGDSVLPWDVSKVTDMSGMFNGAKLFNGDISTWKTSLVTDMSLMFAGADAFDGDISGWDVSSVTDMSSMFILTDLFNSDLSNWNVGQVTTFDSTFAGAKVFNSDVSQWEVSRVTTMRKMFEGAAKFNSQMQGWDVGRVTDMTRMFYAAEEFRKVLCYWAPDLLSLENVTDMFVNTNCENEGDPNLAVDPISPLCFPCTLE